MRRTDWEARLGEYLASVVDRPFEWGVHDCALHSANAVLSMTDIDFAASFRGHYRTAIGSVRALRRYGAGTLEATIDSLFPTIGRAFARRGDLVMHAGALGICVGGDALFVGEEGGAAGLVRIARPSWSKAWRI
ncbi:hypothetical protein M9978_02305 [Sphingomonas sp. MG17]|uniref:DUF6950 domain-containing protein n=1 Tax=Sphingomonas tagetis TaxID=2949092 RepID=A0A9X2HEC2_9SPHN|nr:hypothetical protein [Sphingomonas tagetis]MCP3729248.1 hypothetical protein [Sphingomonas tagetis]